MGDVIAAKNFATLPPVFAACGAGESLVFLLVIWEKICYCVLQEKEGVNRLPLFSHLENRIGSKPHQSTQLPGYCRKVSSGVTSFCAPSGALPTRPNEPTLRRVFDLPVGARLDHLLNRSPHHEIASFLLRGRRSVRRVVCPGCYRVAPTELHT